MPRYDWPSNSLETRTAVLTLPAVSVGTLDRVITWSTPMPDAGYSVQISFEMSTAQIGGLAGVVKPGTLTANGLTVTLSNSLLVSISAGAKLHVTAVQNTE